VRPAVWISALIDQCLTRPGNSVVINDPNLITANDTIYIRQDSTLDQRIWDEIMRITELGDSNGNPWRFWVDADRKCHYEQVSATPLYYIRGGVKRRYSIAAMWNAVSSTYTDTSGNAQTTGVATNDESIAHRGRREYRHYSNYLPSSAALAQRDTWLNEYAYPQARAVGTRRGAKLYTSYGQDVSVVQWSVLPGVIRDTVYPATNPAYDSFLPDGRDFLADEVEASRDGVGLRTWMFSESDLLEAQFDYARRIDEVDYTLED
jgi:hypothetical protein